MILKMTKHEQSFLNFSSSMAGVCNIVFLR